MDILWITDNYNDHHGVVREKQPGWYDPRTKYLAITDTHRYPVKKVTSGLLISNKPCSQPRKLHEPPQFLTSPSHVRGWWKTWNVKLVQLPNRCIMGNDPIHHPENSHRCIGSPWFTKVQRCPSSNHSPGDPSATFTVLTCVNYLFVTYNHSWIHINPRLTIIITIIITVNEKPGMFTLKRTPLGFFEVWDMLFHGKTGRFFNGSLSKPKCRVTASCWRKLLISWWYITGWWLSPTPLKNKKVSWDDYSQYMEK